MSFEIFREKVNGLATQLAERQGKRSALYRGAAKQRWQAPLPCHSWQDDEGEPRDGLLLQWLVAETDMVSAWSNNEIIFTELKSEAPDFLLLRIVLERFAPNIGFLQWGEINRDLIDVFGSSISEIYENTRYSNNAFVDLEELYNYLVDHKLLVDQEPESTPSAGVKI